MMKLNAVVLTGAASLLLLAAACGGTTNPPTPTVTSNSPLHEATEVPRNAPITATFSDQMDRDSLTSTTFTVSAGNLNVPGAVIYAENTATFWPSAHLASNSEFTATVTTGAKSAEAVPLANVRTWKFTTNATLAASLGVNLRSAGSFAVLAKSGISTVPTSVITGDLGVSPAAASSITGFSLTADSSNNFSTSPQVTGKIYAANFTAPTPSNMTTAVSDMELAFTDSASRAPDATELGAGNIGGMTLAPGVYKWGTGLLIPSNVTLNGNANAVWIFQIAQNLTVNSAARVVLTGGALAKNIFWQVSGSVDLGTTSHLEGVVLTQTAVTMRTGATLKGRLMAQTAVNLDSNTVDTRSP